jgi:hypothetical protein
LPYSARASADITRTTRSGERPLDGREHDGPPETIRC